jgi:hypothetical protein
VGIAGIGAALGSTASSVRSQVIKQHSNVKDIARPPGGGSNRSIEFFATLLVPTVVDSESNPIPAGQLGVVRNGPQDSLLMVPDATHRTDKDFFWEGDPWWVGREVGYDIAVRIPAIFIWNSNVSDEEFGEVIFSPGTDAVRFPPNSNGSVILETPRGMKELYLVVKYGATEDVPAPNYFRDSDFSLEVSFRDGSLLKDYAPTNPLVANQINYVVPNESVLQVNKLLNNASTVYNEGISIASDLTRVEHTDIIQRAARELLYWQVRASGIESSELLEQARIEGISGFQSAVNEAPGLSDLIGETHDINLLGPIVGFKS